MCMSYLVEGRALKRWSWTRERNNVPRAIRLHAAARRRALPIRRQLREAKFCHDGDEYHDQAFLQALLTLKCLVKVIKNTTYLSTIQKGFDLVLRPAFSSSIDDSANLYDKMYQY